MSNTPIILEVIIGAGLIAGMWRLVREVSSLSTSLKFLVGHVDDHEDRIRTLEQDA